MEPETRAGRRGRHTRCRETSRAAGGLRFFSLKVVEKIRARVRTTYNAVANELVNDLNNSGGITKDGKSIRRRCYDAINVLLACGLIKRDDKKQILWRGHGSVELDRLRAEVEARRKEVERKRLLCQDVEQKHKALEAFLERTASRPGDSLECGSGCGASSSACSRSSQGQKITMPFVLVQAGADVNVTFSEDRTNVEFELPERPLQVHDDCAVLLKLHQYEVERQEHQQLQQQQQQQQQDAKGGNHLNLHPNTLGPDLCPGKGPGTACIGSPQAPPSDVAANPAARAQQPLLTPAPTRPQPQSQSTEPTPPGLEPPAVRAPRGAAQLRSARGGLQPPAKDKRLRKRQADPLPQPASVAMVMEEEEEQPDQVGFLLRQQQQPPPQEQLLVGEVVQQAQAQGQDPHPATAAPHLLGRPALLARAHCQQQPPQHHQLSLPQRPPPLLPPIRQQQQPQLQLQPQAQAQPQVKPEPQCCELLGLRIPRLRAGPVSINLLDQPQPQQQQYHPTQQPHQQQQEQSHQQQQQLEHLGGQQQLHHHDHHPVHSHIHQQHHDQMGQLSALQQQQHGLELQPQPTQQQLLSPLPETPLAFTISEDFSQLLGLPPLDQHDSSSLLHNDQQQQLHHLQQLQQQHEHPGQLPQQAVLGGTASYHPQQHNHHHLMLGGGCIGGSGVGSGSNFPQCSARLAFPDQHQQPLQPPHLFGQRPLLHPYCLHQQQHPHDQQLHQQYPPALQPQLSLEQSQLLSFEQMVDDDLPLLGPLLPFSSDDPDPLGFGLSCPNSLAADQLGYMGWPYSMSPDPASPSAFLQCRTEPPSSRHPSAIQVGLQR